jgi:cellulase (glycosyl hydrolase family 5)
MRRLLLCLPLLAAVLAMGLPAAASASSKQIMTFEAPRELGSGNPGPTLDKIRAFGVTRIRQLVYWRDIAPSPASKVKPAFDATDPNAYPPGAWDRLDALLAATEARGMTVQLTLTGPVPKWATKARRDTLTDPDPAEFGAFVTAVARRYGQRVALWSIWNEPNQPQFLRPQFTHHKAASPKLYRRLYQAAYAALKANPTTAAAPVLIGETSPRGNEHIVAPLAFMRGMLCLNAHYKRNRTCKPLAADGYAHHAYTTRMGPRFRPPNPSDVTIGVVARLVTALDRAAKAGALPKALPIYLTEFGIQSTPDTVAGVSLARQAAYMAISEHIAYANPRVTSFSQYLMSDDPPQSSGYRYGGFESGLVRSNGKAKPSFDGFRLPLAVERTGRSDILWGLVRPERSATRVTVLAAMRGKPFAPVKTLATKASGVWALRAHHTDGRRYRVQWTAPDGNVYTGPPIRAYE